MAKSNFSFEKRQKELAKKKKKEDKLQRKKNKGIARSEGDTTSLPTDITPGNDQEE